MRRREKKTWDKPRKLELRQRGLGAIRDWRLVVEKILELLLKTHCLQMCKKKNVVVGKNIVMWVRPHSVWHRWEHSISIEWIRLRS